MPAQQQNRTLIELAEAEREAVCSKPGGWTVEEYLDLPDWGFELVDGCLEVLPMPTEAHQSILTYLLDVLLHFVKSRRLGKVLPAGIPVQTREARFREPDIVFMRRENAGRRRNEFWEGSDLAIEIVSARGRERDLLTKRAEYAQAGIPEYWIVDPQNEVITVLVLQEGGYQVSGEFRRGEEAVSVLLPEFAVSVDAVFDSAHEDEAPGE